MYRTLIASCYSLNQKRMPHKNTLIRVLIYGQMEMNLKNPRHGFCAQHPHLLDFQGNCQKNLWFAICRWFFERVFFRFGVAAGFKVASNYGHVSAVTDHKLGVQFFISMR